MIENTIELETGFDVDVYESGTVPLDEPEQSVPPVKHLVLLMHGILSKSDRWIVTKQFVKGRFIDLEVTFAPISYSLTYPWDLFNGRAKEKSILVESRIDHAVKMYEHSVLSIQCHSNGTKVFSRLPERIRHSFIWIFFAGSILHEDEDRLFGKHERHIVNDCGKRDIFPILAEIVDRRSYGQTGVIGFHNPPFYDRFFNFGHSGATDPAHINDWIIPVLLTGTIQDAGPPCAWWRLHVPAFIRWFLRFLVFSSLFVWPSQLG